MTRTHAARQLLALGPLSLAEFVTFTGWPYTTCRRVLSHLVDVTGEVSRENGKYWHGAARFAQLIQSTK
jgi:hypothetical protein